MEYETPQRICIMFMESIASGVAVYWIVRSYIHRYEKGKKFMVSFILLEFVHRVFRALCYLRVPQQVWTTEYLLYYIFMLTTFVLFLKGNPAKHLINLFGPAFLFDLYGTLFMIGVLYLMEQGDLEKVMYIMDFGDTKAAVVFLIACISGTYFIGMLVEAMGHVQAKWMNVAKIILAFMGVYSKSKADCNIVFFGVPAFVVMLLLNAYYQSCCCQKAKRDYEALEIQRKEYDDKTAELDAIKQDALKYLDKNRTGDLEYKKEIIGRFDKVLKNEEQI